MSGKNKDQMTKDALTPSIDQKKDKEAIITIVGFLGAGKTTVLSHILNNRDGNKVAVIVNDMSELDNDTTILKKIKVSELT